MAGWSGFVVGLGREYGFGPWIACVMVLVRIGWVSWPLSVCQYWMGFKLLRDRVLVGRSVL